MSTIQHHAIVVTSWQVEAIVKAQSIAYGVFPWVSEVSPDKTNGYRSFFIPPDGSKESWGESNEGDERREKFYAAIRASFGDKRSLWVDVIELTYGELMYGAIKIHTGG